MKEARTLIAHPDALMASTRAMTSSTTRCDMPRTLFFLSAADAAGDVPKMDNGLTEHTGCPLREGRKWIATMWYREGVDPVRNWEYFSRRGAFGV